jgi:site-specific DNA-methyltransferase (adenine-specific)
MGKKKKSKTPASGKPSSLIDTRVIFCGDNLDQLKKFPPGCVDLIYIDPPFNSNRNYEVFWGETEPFRITRSLRGRAKSTRTRRRGKIPAGVVKTTSRTILTRQHSHRALQPAAVERGIRIGSKEKRSFEDRHASTQAYIDFMRPRCVELHHVLKKTGSFYYHCDWHASLSRFYHAGTPIAIGIVFGVRSNEPE